MPELTVVVLTKNEAGNIEACLDSVAWADQRIVLDCGSQDATVELARKLGAMALFHPFLNFADQRNWALEMVKSEWVFFVDADERATPELGHEVRQAIAQQDIVGWWVPRHNYIWGRWIKHAGWSPDYQLRLLRRGYAHYDPKREVHEIVLLDGPEGYLRNPLIHYNYQTIAQFMRKQEVYTRLEAGIQVRQGVRPKWWKYFSQPCREFWRRYITLEGYKDGGHGFLLSLLLAYYQFLMYVRLRQLVRSSGVPTGE